MKSPGSLPNQGILLPISKKIPIRIIKTPKRMRSLPRKPKPSINKPQKNVTRDRVSCPSFSFFTSHFRPSNLYFLHKPFFFAIDAPAILLAIQSHRFGNLHPSLPSLSKIFIIKWDSDLLSNAFSCLSNFSVILMSTLQKGS